MTLTPFSHIFRFTSLGCVSRPSFHPFQPCQQLADLISVRSRSSVLELLRIVLTMDDGFVQSKTIITAVSYIQSDLSCALAKEGRADLKRS